MQTLLMLKTFDRRRPRFFSMVGFVFSGGSRCEVSCAKLLAAARMLPRYVSRGTRYYPSGQQALQYRSNGRNYQGISMVLFLLPEVRPNMCETSSYFRAYTIRYR